VISDGGSALALTKAGAGSLTLSGTNTYTGTSTISAGSIIIGADAGLGAAPGSAAAGHFVFASGGSGTLNTTASFTLNTNRGIALTGNGIINTNTSRTLTYAGVIAGSGTITKAGAGTLTLSGTNTHSGSNIISAGTLSVAGDRAFGAVPGSTDADNITFVSSGSGIINVSGNFTLNTKRGITLTGDGNIGVAASRTLTYAGIITGDGKLTKSSAGTLTISGVSNFKGGTLINAGSLTLGASGVLYDSGTVELANTTGAVFNLAGYDETIGKLQGGGSNGGNVTLGSGTLGIYILQGQSATYAGVISGSGNVYKTYWGNGDLTLTGQNTFTGGITISGGSIIIGVDNGLATSGTVTFTHATHAFGARLVVENGFSQTIGTLSGNNTQSTVDLFGGDLTVTQGSDATYAGSLRGTGTFTKAGSNTLTLSNSIIFSGPVVINAGSLTMGGDSGLQNSVSLANTSGVILNLGGNDVFVRNLSGGGTSGGNIVLGSGELIIDIVSGSNATFNEE